MSILWLKAMDYQKDQYVIQGSITFNAEDRVDKKAHTYINSKRYFGEELLEFCKNDIVISIEDQILKYAAAITKQRTQTLKEKHEDVTTHRPVTI